MELQSIPGVGAKTAEALGALEDPARALRDGDVGAIARAPGISTGQAARIARAAIQAEHDDPGDFLATDRAQQIYDGLLGLLQRHAVTGYGRHRLETLYPSARRSRIEEVRDFVEGALAREPTEAVDRSLAGVEPLVAPRGVRVRDRCIATADAEMHARASEAFPELSIELVEDARDVGDLAKGYAEVTVLDDRFAGLDLAANVSVDPEAIEAPAQVVPERVLAFFGRNRASIRAAIEVTRAVELEPPCALDELERALDRVDETGAMDEDEELARLNRACDDLDAATATAESIADDALRGAIQRRDVTVEGADLLSLVERGAGVDSLLERELAAEVEDALAEAREHFVDALGLTDGERDLAVAVFPDRHRYPIERDGAAFRRLETELTAARDRYAATETRALAAELEAFRDPVETLVRNALELDVELAIARFARAFDCTMPTFVEAGIEIEAGRSPMLADTVAAVEPVTYAVEGVTLLTGVNSGGKTSTLDLLAAVAILAQMGLPVPADRARLRRFERLHYHAKSRGTLDAGAFEGTVREFGALVTDADGSLILVDELESITEPGASAKLIAGFLETLAAGDGTAVFVTHLAEEIAAEAAIDVDVDGIEAAGLADGELVVDRSPRKDHLARSTPELILEKLAGEEPDDGFYAALLEKFGAD